MSEDQYFQSLDVPYWNEQEPAYGSINFSGKKVIIVGSEVGTTTVYAWKKGAKEIIQYEKDNKLRETFLNKVYNDYKMDISVTQKGEWRNEYPDGDVFIMDCEGCENWLIPQFIHKYQQWCIAIHEWTLRFKELVIALSPAKITYKTPDSKEIVLCNV